MASMKDVAREAGVSVATVSHVLRGTKRVSSDLTERVRAAAQALGYVPNPQASALRTGRTDTLGVVLPDLTNPFFVALLRALARAARAAGKALMVYESENDDGLEREGLARLAAGRADGLIWVPVDADAALDPAADGGARRLVGGVPLVTIDRPLPGTDAVVADHVAGGALVARHLKALGHTRVALLSGPGHRPSSRGRRRGFLEELAPLEPVWELEMGYSHELPAEGRERLAAGGFGAVACANDVVAFAVMRQLRERGVSVPGDVSVTGFDDIFWAPFAEPPLTTVRQPLAALSGAAVRLLLERIQEPERATRGVVMPVELVRRGSTAAPAGARPEATQGGGTHGVRTDGAQAHEPESPEPTPGTLTVRAEEGQ